jgi:hypothetical protein
MTMKSRSMSALGMVATAMFAAVPLLAHHSFAAEYDRAKPVMLTGTVSRVEWINPHAHFQMDVKDPSGTTGNWDIELGSPAGLLRNGWTRNSLKIGEEVTVDGYLAKDGKPLDDGSLHANSRQITTANGRKVFVGSSAPEAPQ